MVGRRRMNGGAWYNDVLDGLKSVASTVIPILKSTGIAGNLASSYNPAAGAVVKSLGFGRKRRRVRGSGVKRVIKM